MKQWWNNETIAEFRKAAQCIVDQYSNYTLDDVNLAIDGRLTQGENIADNGGLKQAYRVSTILIHPRAHRVLSIQHCFHIFCSWKSCWNFLENLFWITSTYCVMKEPSWAVHTVPAPLNTSVTNQKLFFGHEVRLQIKCGLNSRNIFV